MDHIIFKDYIVNRRSFIYCSLASALQLDEVTVVHVCTGSRQQRYSRSAEVCVHSYTTILPGPAEG